ncbi:hypothetical protein COOONC_06755 [Cooperia oncophora]
MPPKPNEARKKLAFYNIDFSLEHQRTLAGQSPSSSISSLQSTTKEKDPVARRKDFIRRRKQQTDQEDASKVIQVGGYLFTDLRLLTTTCAPVQNGNLPPH